MTPLVIEAKVDSWLAQHEAWVGETTERAALVEAWRVNVDDYGAAHPASLGILLALVREVWGICPDSMLRLLISDYGSGCYIEVKPYHEAQLFELDATSLAEAIVEALLAAKPEASKP